jgi:hypothetical protein
LNSTTEVKINSDKVFFMLNQAVPREDTRESGGAK